MLEQAAIDNIKTKIIEPVNHLINGQSMPASDGARITVTSPINGEQLTTIAAGTTDDMNTAIEVARQTFENGDWSKMSPNSRKNIMLKWADLIYQHALELAVLGVRDNGTEISMAFKAESMSAVETIKYYAEAINKTYGEIAPTNNDTLGLVHREPIGVVGAIIPWNFPLMIGAWKIAPALACGNSVVVKPSESASLALLKLCQLGLEAGLPNGVLNVVTGRGTVVGEAMALSHYVDVLTFTGSGNTGRRLLEYSARSNLKRVYLELGGKSPHIIFNDVKDIDKAVAAVANGIFRNSGQVCVAGSRLLVEADIYDEFIQRVINFTKTMKRGDPLSVDTQIGCVHSEEQMRYNLNCVEQAQEEGCEILMGGKRDNIETGGTYMEPTIISSANLNDSIIQREVFGPVLAVSKFIDEKEAISLANCTEFGLAAGLWTSDLSKAHRMIRAIHSGVVHVNTYGGSDITVPLGGIKQSGNGHDKSLHALDKYCDLKTAWVAL
jgi:gamma-glutamyl-gamma-aminobutyraldehyde dehydrogenase